MPTHYVDSAAIGLNLGTSWGDAWVSIASAFTNAVAGDKVLIDDGHNEDFGGDTTLVSAGTSDDPIAFICADKADDSLSTGAVITNTGGAFHQRWRGSLYCYGLGIRSREIDFLTGGVNGSLQTYEQCIFIPGLGGGAGFMQVGLSNGPGTTTFLECDFNADNAATLYLYADLIWKGGSANANLGNINSAFDGTGCLIDGVDLSLVNDADLIDPPAVSEAVRSHIIQNCTVHANFAITAGPILSGDTLIASYNCQVGNAADPAFQMQEHRYFGVNEGEATRYRTGGASDGERANPYSIAMTTNANAKEIYAPLEGPPITAWTDGDGAQAYIYTVYFASDALMQDDEVWLELFLPNDANTSSQQARVSTRMAPQGTPANVTADGVSVWNGVGVGTKQLLSTTYTPDKPGVMTARVYLAKPSDTIYVDPMIVVTT